MDELTPQPPRLLEYRNAAEDRQMHPLLSVILFMLGLVVSLVLTFILGALLLGAFGSASDAYGRTLVFSLGLCCFIAAAGSAVLAFRVIKRNVKVPLLLGFLCGVCLACLADGFCFTIIAGS